MTEINVIPHIGSMYERPEIFPHKTLILGESNYTDRAEDFRKNLVKECIDSDLIGDDPNFQRFSTKTRRVIFGRDTVITKEKFWDNVAFYNFVQFLVGNQARVKPTQEMWENSVPAFKELITDIKPERILVLGLANWRNLLFYIENKGITEFTAELDIDNYIVLSGYINHPSSGIRYNDWQPIAKQLLFQSTLDKNTDRLIAVSAGTSAN
jgi:hypothetical protein